MAHIVTMYEDDPSRRRYKVVFECRNLSTDGSISRKRKSKTFPPRTPLRTVKAFAREMEQKYDLSEGIDYNKNKLSLDQFAEEYFQYYTNNLSPSTVLGYKRAYYSEVHGISKSLGKIELANLTTLHIQRYVNYLQEQCLKPKTIRNMVGIIHSMFDRAIKLRYVERGYNVVTDVELPKIQKEKIQSYSVEEVKVLLSLADEYAREELRFLIYLAVGTGARRSEIAAMKIEDVDFVKKEWSIKCSKVCAGATDVIKAPKTQSSVRTIPLSDSICREVRGMIQRYEKNKALQGRDFEDTRFLFSNEFGKPYRTNTLTKWYIAFMKAHTDVLRYICFHGLRHTYSSLAVYNQVDLPTVSSLLGHANISTTLDIYTSSYASSKKAYAQLLEKTIFSDESD